VLLWLLSKLAIDRRRYAALFGGGMLTEHPVLKRYLEGITGSECAMDGPLRVLGSWNDSLLETPSRVPLHRCACAALFPLPLSHTNLRRPRGPKQRWNGGPRPAAWPQPSVQHQERRAHVPPRHCTVGAH